LTSPRERRSQTEPATEKAAGFILFREGRSGEPEFLLLRHRNDGHWGFPKGRIELGETLIEAALRETREETGFTDLAILPDVRYRSSYRLHREGRGEVCKTVEYFLARVAGDPVELSSEHSRARWLPLHEALAVLQYEEARALLREAHRHLLRANPV
jgi:8-oxo-dGTP diphosphatase